MNIRTVFAKLVGILLLLALLVAACGDDGGSASSTSASGVATSGAAAASNTTAAATTTAAPKSGGTLTIGTFTETPGLDPVTNVGTGVTGGMELAALYDVLMRYDPATGTFQPRLAQSLTPNSDLTVWTLKLRSGIKFTDGTDYNAAAVVFNLKRHIDLKGRSLGLVSNMKSFDTPDPLTVVITLTTPNTTIPFVLSSAPGMIASPAVVQAQGANFATNPVNAGAGPFVFSSFKAKEAVILKKNPTYWNGAVYLDELKFVNITGQQANLDAMKNNTLQAALLRDPATLVAAKDAGYSGLEAAQSAGNTMAMNNGVKVACTGGQPAAVCTGQADGTLVATKTATSDKRVRQAVAAAINLDTMNTRVFQGKAQLDTALFAKTSRWSSGVAGPKFDLEQAKKLVTEAKTAGWDGTIRLSCHNGLPEWGIAVQALLEQAGFKVTRDDNKAVADNTAAVVTRKDFDLACFGVSILDEEPFSAISREFSFSGYTSAEVDAAVESRAGGHDRRRQEEGPRHHRQGLCRGCAIPVSVPGSAARCAGEERPGRDPKRQQHRLVRQGLAGLIGLRSQNRLGRFDTPHLSGFRWRLGAGDGCSAVVPGFRRKPASSLVNRRGRATQLGPLSDDRIPHRSGTGRCAHRQRSASSASTPVCLRSA